MIQDSMWDATITHVDRSTRKINLSATKITISFKFPKYENTAQGLSPFWDPNCQSN